MSIFRALLLSLALVVPACGGSHAAGPTVAVVKAPTDPIALASVNAYLSQRFSAQLAAKTFAIDYGSAETDQEVFGELAAMGITRIDQLAAIIPADFDTRAAGAFTTEDPQNVPGVLRDLMMIHDAPRYFKDAWKQHWMASSEKDFTAAIAYGLDYASLAQYGVISGDGEVGGDDGEEGGVEGGMGGDDGNPCGGGDEGGDDGEGNPCGE
ncbi:MAG: hypothetical protein K8W52_18280 [Deltaproteobacteria bacterium]|nr:hypothetical protein [Deltaproteobacteria bacterium]